MVTRIGWYVVPCGAAKLDHRAPAADLYVGGMFRLALQAARAAAGDDARVLILSALHGLVSLDQQLAPYDHKMGQPGSVPAVVLAYQLQRHGALAGDRVTTLLPKAYLAALQPALDMLELQLVNAYADAPGIGYQRGVCAAMIRAQEVSA